MDSGVYMITNAVNNKVYVGSSKYVARRCRSHFKSLRKGVHPNILLQRAWNKYGEAAFSVKTLKLCFEDQRICLEQKYIDTFFSANPRYGYNLATNAAGGHEWKSEQRTAKAEEVRARFGNPEERVRQSKRIQAFCNDNPEFGLVLSKAGADAKRGAKASDETKAKMAEARRLHWARLTPKQRADREYKCGNAMRGKHLTDKQRERVSVGLVAALAKLPPEQLSARVKKAWAGMIPEQIAERSRKIWATRRLRGTDCWAN